MRTERRKTSVMLAVVLTATALCGSAVDAIASTGGAPAASGQAAGAGSGEGELSSTVSTRRFATWFGPGFFGKQTACGQTLTPEVIGVAHRTLPCGTLVRLSYRGRSMVVPVIDRGPYHRGVMWDLTAGAARALGVAGKARVSALLVGQVENTPLLGAPAGNPAAGTSGGSAAS